MPISGRTLLRIAGPRPTVGLFLGVPSVLVTGGSAVQIHGPPGIHVHALLIHFLRQFRQAVSEVPCEAVVVGAHDNVNSTRSIRDMHFHARPAGVRHLQRDIARR